MEHVPLGTIIWIVFLAIGLISSIVKKGREGGAAVARIRERQAAQAREHTMVATVMAPPQTASPPVVAQPPPPPLPSSAPPIIVRRRDVAPPATPFAEPAHASPPVHVSNRFRGMFERGNLVRAIVAAEVLGPPKALQEQSIWSPPHSEPST